MRLKYRFGTTHTGVSSGKELAAPLQDYASRTSSAVTTVSPATGHRATFVFSRFSMGDYGEVARLPANNRMLTCPHSSRVLLPLSASIRWFSRGASPTGQFLVFLPEERQPSCYSPTPRRRVENGDSIPPFTMPSLFSLPRPGTPLKQTGPTCLHARCLHKKSWVNNTP